MRSNWRSLFAITFLFMILITGLAIAGTPVQPQDLLSIQTPSSVQISPDGKKAAYVLYVPRTVKDDPGGSWGELHVIDLETGTDRGFITGQVNVSSPQWQPDGSHIAFLMTRGDKAKRQVWSIPIDGGEAFPLTEAKNGVIAFKWHPTGKKIAYIATEPKSEHEKKLEEKGFGFIFFEENLEHKNLYLYDLETKETVQLTEGATVWDFVFSPDGDKIAAGITPKNLIDHDYMFKRIHLIDVATKERRQVSQNEGKLGNYEFSPDGQKLAYTAAKERKDHAVSQVYVLDLKNGSLSNLTPANFRGHVSWVTWKDNQNIIYEAAESVWPTISQVGITGGERKILLHSRNSGVIFSTPSFNKEKTAAVFTGSRPNVPGQVYLWSGKEVTPLTALNPEISKREMGRQEVIQYKSRDGAVIEGLLIYPVGYEKGTRYPLVVIVHGGPESNYSNGWLSHYSTPGQVLAGKGYLVFYPNYRSSTGYGLEYAAVGYNDAAGKEFDDIADGIDYLVESGLADRDRVGLGGGSYGGFASAWFATYYTKYVKAVCMFVGISDLISKRGTTDIPYEELYVHSGKPLEEMWDQALKRSPIYWAHQSKTATLIYGGTADTRVHPSQSLELYRRLKMNNHPAVRLVQYPGEGHGNSKLPGRIDVLYRILDWYDWYVKDASPLDGPMPPLDISDKYGLEE